MKIIAILHNIRSAYNVGSCFRTADGAGIEKFFLTGYTPAPKTEKNAYETQAHKTLAKTALGAEKSVPWEKRARLAPLLKQLKREGFEIVALEQSEKSIDYSRYIPNRKVVVLVGNEVRGIDPKILKQCDQIIEIPMHGQKNSLNVSVAFGIVSFAIADKMRDSM